MQSQKLKINTFNKELTVKNCTTYKVSVKHLLFHIRKLCHICVQIIRPLFTVITINLA